MKSPSNSTCAVIIMPKNEYRVYIENIMDYDRNKSVCVYVGTSLEELKDLFYSVIPAHENIRFDFYTKRSGMARNSLCPDVLPDGLGEVYVRAKSTIPMNCATCGSNNNVHSA